MCGDTTLKDLQPRAVRDFRKWTVAEVSDRRVRGFVLTTAVNERAGARSSCVVLLSTERNDI